jgi:hypothetical protein
MTVTSSISHRKATSEGANPGGSGNAMLERAKKDAAKLVVKLDVTPTRR